ncbi:MAG: TonB-dependent receptor [Paludibacteraceae bacterium]
MKRLCLLFLLFFSLFFASSQELKLTSIQGEVMDADSKGPLEFATVQLLQLPDSSLATGAITDKDGSFVLKAVKKGKYLLRVSFVGYNVTDKNLSVDGSGRDLNLKTLVLAPDSKLLESVTVVGQAAPVTMKNDTIEFNSTAFRVADGAMLEELVKKLPGAEITSDGKLMVNGKEIKKILVDGKEFFSDDPKVSLKNLPANMVEKVKTYDKKSENATMTGMDDDDDETVLDLTVKKGMKKGWFGNVLGGLGNKERYEAGGMMNRFTDDSNFSVLASVNNTNNIGFSEFGDADFGKQGNAGMGISSAKVAGATFARDYKNTELGGSVQYGYSDNDAQRKSSSETFLSDGSSYKNDTSTSRRKRDDVAVSFRLKWKPDSMNTLLFIPKMTYSKTKSSGFGASQTSNSLRVPVNRKSSLSNADGDNLNANGTLRYVRRLNGRGRNVSVMAKMDCSHNQSNNYANSETDFFLFDEDGNAVDSVLVTDRYTDKKSSSYTYGFEVAYTEPLSKRHFLQLKYGFQYRYSESQSFSFDRTYEPSAFLDSLSSKVENNYNNHVAEIGLQGKYTNLNYNVGFSVQPQHSSSETSVGPNSGTTLTQNLVNFAPNIRFRYKFSKKNSLSLNYRGQSSAPNIEYLQEVIDQDDPLNLKFGNPDLKPSFTNNVRMRYNNYNSESQRSLMLNLGYSNTRNAVANKMIYNTITGGKETYKVNVNGNWNSNAYLVYNTPVGNRKFTVSISSNANYSERVSFASEGKNDSMALENAQECVTRSLSLKEKLVGGYRTERFDVSVNASVAYLNTYNKVQRSSNRNTFDYEFGGSSNVNLPWDVSVSTDVNYNLYSGYTDGFDDNEVIWNAQIAKNFLKNNAATIRIKVYDILQQQNNLTRSVSETEITDTEYNTLGSYFMVHFVYRINTLGKRAARKEDDRPMGGERRIR